MVEKREVAAKYATKPCYAWVTQSAVWVTFFENWEEQELRVAKKPS